MKEYSNNFYGENYPHYFNTPHWKRLKEQLIYQNKRARCFIDDKTYSLLLHHESYDNLFHEVFKKDIIILCFNCHKQVHFYTLLFIFKREVRLKKRYLKKRRLFLRFIYLVQNKRFALALFTILRYTLIL